MAYDGKVLRFLCGLLVSLFNSMDSKLVVLPCRWQERSGALHRRSWCLFAPWPCWDWCHEWGLAQRVLAVQRADSVDWRWIRAPSPPPAAAAATTNKNNRDNDKKVEVEEVEEEEEEEGEAEEAEEEEELEEEEEWSFSTLHDAPQMSQMSTTGINWLPESLSTRQLRCQ